MQIALFIFSAISLLIGFITVMSAAFKGYGNLVQLLTETKAEVAGVKKDVENIRVQLRDHIDEAHTNWGSFHNRLERLEKKP